MTQAKIVVLDSGGCTIKAGFAGDIASLRVVPNCIAKVKGERQGYIADTVDSCPEVLSLVVRRPVDRGYIVSWDLQRDIWLRVLRSVLAVTPSSVRLVLTEPIFNLPALHEAALQVLFDEIGIQAVYMAPPAVFSLKWFAHCHPHTPASIAECGLVVDAGFSFTHAIPIFGGRVVERGVRRIDLGGKALTNHMKTQVSYRSINMMDETYLMEHIKEQLCFVSQDPEADLAASRGRTSAHRRIYVLPDGISSKLGHVLDEAGGEQLPSQRDTALVVNNERFMVPEALFHPSGGTAACPGFRDRVEAELRPLVPDAYKLGVYLAEEPITSVWKGAALAATDPALASLFYTREEYRSAAPIGNLATQSMGASWEDED